MLSWITSPLTPYAALAAGLLSCLALFVTLKKEIAGLRILLHESREALPVEAPAALPVEAPVATPALPPQTIPEAVLPAPDLNLTVRAQALRMEHRGESIPTIAAALRVPRNEIALLLKLQQKLGAEQSQLR